MSLRKSFVLTMVGRDHPGIVNRLSNILLEHKANWLESRMANLQGEFAGILHADIDARQFTALLAELQKLQAEGLQIIARETGSDSPDSLDLRTLELEVVGTDRPGIVRDIADVLTRFEINIEEISTEFSEAPMSSTPLFRATAHLTAHQGIDLDAVQMAIENIGNDLMTELRIRIG